MGVSLPNHHRRACPGDPFGAAKEDARDKPGHDETGNISRRTYSGRRALIACLAIAGAFTAGFLTGPAPAQKNPEPFQFQFAYTAEDMASLPSAKILLARLERDVREDGKRIDNIERKGTNRAEFLNCVQMALQSLREGNRTDRVCELKGE